MSARTLTVLARARAAPLFALAALVALAALAAATLAPPTSAAPPGDLTLTLRLIEDSDNIVPAGSSLRVSATLSSTTADPELDVISGTLRVSGSQEWEHNGRSSYSVATTFMAPVNGAGSGSAVDMQERTTANGGDIVAIGAPNDTVGTTAAAGSVRLFVGGDYKMRLTAPTPAANAKFGQSVAVAGSLIVVGAAQNAYVYNEDGTLVATLSPRTEAASGANVPLGYGSSVAIDDAAATIVVGSTGGHASVAANGAAYIFTRPTTGWTSADTDTAIAVTSTASGNDAGKMVGSPVAISGDGSTLAVGAPLRNRTSSGDNQQGGVLVFVKPSGGWAATAAATATLRTDGTDSFVGARTGSSVDINADGSVIVAGQPGNYAVTKTTWAGAAFVFTRPTGGWTGFIANPVKLSDTDSANGDQFGHDVAINAAGDTVAVSNALKITTTIVTPATTDEDGDPVAAVTSTAYGTGDVHVFSTTGAWAASTAAGTVLTSPQTDGKVFGGGLAIYGDDTLIVGQTETIAADVRDDDAGITSGGGRAYSVNLGATDVQASAALINAETLPCSSRTVDLVNTRTCAVDLDTNVDATVGYSLPMITIPAGTPDGTFTISANFTVTDDGDAKRNITATREVTIGTVTEADHATFTFSRDLGDPTVTGDEKNYDSNIAVGGSTQLLLRILSSKDSAAGAGAVSSLLFTTTTGTLTLLNPVGAASGTCALTCQVDVSKLNASNSDKIVVQLTHPGSTNKASSTMVRAQVLPKGGGSLLEIDPVTVTFSGAATKLTVSEPATGVLNVNTASGDTGSDDAKDARETRDRLRFSVSLTDANDSNVKALPSGSLTTRIKDPDGKVVWRTDDTGNFTVLWPLKKTVPDGDDADTLPDIVDDLDAAGNRQVQLDVNAPDTAPLKNGEYTLEVKAGQLTGTQTFTVSGGPETIEISEPDGELTIGGRFTLTATLSDADGSAVPDGTPVTFTATRTGALNVLVKVREKTTTTDGQVSITYEVVAAGRDSVRVSSGTAGNVILISTAEVAPEEPAAPANPADSLSRKMPNDYSSWLGEGTTTASALLDGLGDGFSAILLWYNGAWLRYGVVDGRPVPGQSNFEVRTGAILWLTSG